jgi:hypothetical protein
MSTDFTNPENQHPVLKLFPPMSEEDLKELAADIKANGQREPVRYIMRGGKQLLLDGQNRVAACKIAGVSVEADRYGYWDADSHVEEESLVPYVLSANLKRRHLTPAQRAAIVVSAQTMTNQFAAEAKERQKAALAKANAERKAVADAAKAVQKDTEAAEEFVNGAPAVVPEAEQPPQTEGRTNEKIAALANVGTTLVASLLRIQKHAPELMKKIIAGDTSVEHAERVVAQRQAAEKEKAREAAKAKPKKEKPKKDKPPREFGIWKVGAILFGSIQCAARDSNTGLKWFDVPLLFEVLEVRQTHAACKEVSGRVDKNNPFAFRMKETSGKHDYKELKALRVATAADKKMVEKVWETVTEWK